MKIAEKSGSERRWSSIGLQLMLGLLALGLLIELYLLRDFVIPTLWLWHERVGVAMFGLLPLTVFFLFIVGHVLFAPEARRAPWVSISLNVVSMAAPLLGMLGTVLGMSAGTSQFTLEQGVEHLLTVVTGLMQSLSVVLLSTAWGILLALPSLLMQAVLFPERHDEPREHAKARGTQTAAQADIEPATAEQQHARKERPMATGLTGGAGA